MSTTKETIAKQMKGTGVANQEALVKRLLRKTVQPIKMIVPGGTSLFDTVDKTNISDTIYTWLRRTNQFVDVQISLAKDPSKYKLTKRKVEDLDNFEGGPVWWKRDFGKRKLAEIMGTAMFDNEAVIVEANKEGVWVYEDSEKDPKKRFSEKSSDFEPYVEFTPAKTKEEYKE